MRYLKRILSLMIILLMIVSIAAVGTTGTSAAGTGTGLAEWALNAYYSGWSYVYGGSSPGAVDCSGLIYSYAGGYRNNFEPYASDIGYVANGIPNIHGLVLATPSHYGVYVGNGMAVDARGAAYGVVYSSVSSRRWDTYFKAPGVSYPTTGWERFNGDYYYYENGEYITNTSRTIDGITYNFSSSGASDKTPGNTDATTGQAPTASENPSPTESTTASSAYTQTDPPEEPAEPDAPDEDEEVTYKLGDTGEEVMHIQQRLKDLHYYDGEIDGIFGESTQAALISFQKNNGLYGTGTADPFSMIVLDLENATEAPDETEPEMTEEPSETEETDAEESTAAESEATEGKVESVLPSTAPITAVIAEVNTEFTSEIISQTSNFSARALANLTSGAEVTNLQAPSDNSDFMRWFFVVLMTMGVSFAVALSLEKIGEKRAKARRKSAHRYKAAHIRK